MSEVRGGTRRAFMENGALILAGTAASTARAAEKKPAARIGLLTDLHYADKAMAGSRHYRESVPKLREAVERFRTASLDFVVELGDFIDAADTVKEELAYLETIDRELERVGCPRHYVLGNHCVATLTKEEFVDNCGARKPFYSFDAGGLHFVILDACFTHEYKPYGRKNFEWTDTNVAPAEIEWLQHDLKRTRHKTVVFIHQRLDVGGHYGVKNAAAVRKVLTESGTVVAVFQGHNHVNDHKEIDGVHYCTLNAVVEGSGAPNSAYAVMEVWSDGAIRVRGFRKQSDYRL